MYNENMMIDINLLPKSFQKSKFDFSLGKTGVYAIAAAAVIVIMLISITFYQKYQISQLDENIQRAKQRAAMLQKDIQLVDALSEVKQKVQRRMQAVEQLDSHRSAWVRILENFAKNIPEFVWMGKFEEQPIIVEAPKNKGNAKDTNEAPKKQKDPSTPTVRQADVEGYAFTLNALASFMINMMRSDYFENVELKSSQEIELEDKKTYQFVISCDVHYLSDEDLRNKIADADLDNKQAASTSHKSLN